MIQAGIFTNVCMGVVYIILKEWSLNKGAVRLASELSYLRALFGIFLVEYSTFFFLILF